MELMKTSMAAVLRILLTLTLLSGLSQAAATTSVPEGIGQSLFCVGCVKNLSRSPCMPL